MTAEHTPVEVPETQLAGKVRTWLNKTGLPLELEAVTAFRRAGFECAHSELYEDPETKKGREVDFVAQVRHELGLVRICFVGECKASGNPWVVLREAGDSPGHLTYASLGASHEGSASKIGWGALHRSDAGLMLTALDVGGYALKQAFSENVDHAYTAAVGVLKAAYALLQQAIFQPPRLVFAMPLIVVDAPIFECWVDEAGTVQLKEVQYSAFLFAAHIPEQRRAVIRIVRRECLDGYAKLCARLAGSLMDLSRPYADEWLKEREAERRRAEDF
jgi:hypothetical protein